MLEASHVRRYESILSRPRADPSRVGNRTHMTRFCGGLFFLPHRRATFSSSNQSSPIRQASNARGRNYSPKIGAIKNATALASGICRSAIYRTGFVFCDRFVAVNSSRLPARDILSDATKIMFVSTSSISDAQCDTHVLYLVIV